MNKPKKILKQLIKVLLFFVLSIILGLAFLLFWASIGVFSNQIFNKKEWLAIQTNVSDTTCYRGGMAMYIKNLLLNNAMTKADVVSLLGKPDSEELNQIEYTLGMCSGLSIDYDGLIISFSENGKFVSASIIQH